MKSIKLLSLFLLVLMFIIPVYAQQEESDKVSFKQQALNVYLDRVPFEDHIRREITFVNYVRDPKEADVHILVTTMQTGSGGREYTIQYIGQKECSKLQNTLKYYSKSTSTRYEIREEFIHTLKIGLAPYITKTPMINMLKLQVKEGDIEEESEIKDKWDYWRFNLGFSTDFEIEETREEESYDADIDIDRITEASKLSISLRGRYDSDSWTEDEDTERSISRTFNFSSLFVKSLTDHWSIGAWLSLRSSTRQNLEFQIKPQPAVEYNIFPYSQSTHKQLRFLYKAGYEYNKYHEETVYFKTSEKLSKESLSLILNLIEPWGEAWINLTWSHYFHDITKNNLSCRTNLSIRIFKGFSVDLWGHFSAIHDQLYLANTEVALEDILLNRRELETGYSFNFRIGFSYKFGSIYNNIVNPRFGNGRRHRRYY
ncbi:MAG: hypothetical protein R6V04_08085 [bacterium]